ncbi:tRNA-dihydrouridine(47) synthase [NAD(P)(+)]-like isoform X2 [Manis pentadactyla]|uniref:tRNA-dihydrouridine(47) synthase [NAD(P)(+)]-like isoform X2 n=1 Tax=Manis pentadactyla TaxID=143292 RepID=UPI00255CDC80|nr:tRNA-dihydrouridine(47) synthase [NAD(P)(+)]-like isoform X2 [Manis pentadactyla]
MATLGAAQTCALAQHERGGHTRYLEGLPATLRRGLAVWGAMAEGAAEASVESGGGGDSGAGAPERGVAPIKPQFRTTKKQFHDFLEAKGQTPSQETEAGNLGGNDLSEPEAKRIRLEDGHEEDRQSGEAAGPQEQPQVQKRARGQNRGRAHLKPTHWEKNRLCPSLVQESAAKCFFGDRCRFLHDVGCYLETKPADLGPRCVLYETFGKCPYGVTCRFAGAHLGPEGQNLVQEPPVQVPLVRNSLDKALQLQLRKRKIHFERAERALRQLSKGQLPGSTPAAADPEPVGSEGAPGQDGCAAQQASLGAGAGAPPSASVQTCGPLTDEDVVRLRPCEKKRCGNLPFRRICKRFGADVTCGEMAVCTNLLQGQTSEWALLKRHPCEDIFGVQLEGAFPDTMTKCAELLNRTIEVDFVDINVGCPIDLVYRKGGGCALMNRSTKFQQIVRGMNQVLDVPLTVKIRTGVQERVNLAHRLLPELRAWGTALVTLHGRSREQRYTKLADWRYIEQCVTAASPMPLFAPPGDPGLANSPQELVLPPTRGSLTPQPLPLRKRGHLVVRGRQPRHADWSRWGHDCPRRPAQAVAVHGDQGAAALGHLVGRAPGHPARLHALRPGALGLGHAGRGEDAPLPPRVALLPVQARAGMVRAGCVGTPAQPAPARLPAGTCPWGCWSGSRRGSTSGRPATWAVTTWRRSWPARRPPTGSASVRCCWDPYPPTSSSCQSIRPTRTSSRGSRRRACEGPAATRVLEKTINFILLKPRLFCDSEHAPSPHWNFSLNSR